VTTTAKAVLKALYGSLCMVVSLGIFPLIPVILGQSQSDSSSTEKNIVNTDHSTVLSYEWNPFTSAFLTPQETTLPAENIFPSFYIPDKNTTKICLELFPLLIRGDLSPLSKTVYTSDNSSVGAAPGMEGSVDIPSFILYNAATEIFNNHSFLERLISESRAVRWVASTIYTCFFFYLPQPFAPYGGVADVMSRFLGIERKPLEISFDERYKTGYDCFNKGVDILQFILERLRVKDVDDIDNYLSVFFDLMVMCGCSAEYSLQLLLQRMATNIPQPFVSEQAFIDFTPLTVQTKNIDEKINGDKIVKCTHPVIRTSLLFFVEILSEKCGEKALMLHFVYALADYCRICPPLRKWFMTEGLPVLGFISCVI
jgi:hypothetical protein